MTTTAAKTPRRGRKLDIRASIGIALIVSWSAALLTGVLLYVAPEGRRSGRTDLLFGISKATWGEIHWWISLVAVGLTVVHLIVDWKTFRSCVRHLTHTHGREPAPCK